MGYEKQGFSAGDILHATQLNSMDDQIFNNGKLVDSMQKRESNKALVLGTFLEFATINSSGVISETTKTGDYSCDMYFFPVIPRTRIKRIGCYPNTVFLGFFSSENIPSLSSVSYNNARTEYNSSSVSDVLVPDGVNWIGVRCKHNVPCTIEYDMKVSYVPAGGDINDCIDTNLVYYQTASTVASHAPLSDGGGWIFAFKIYSGYIFQIYICDRSSTNGAVYVRRCVNNYFEAWTPIRGGIRRDVKIAFFGDSIVQSNVGSTNNILTTEMSSLLNATVDNYGRGSQGYLVTSQSLPNIYEYVQTVDLSSYTHALFLAGDNDSSTGSSGIGTYLDTGVNETVLGNIYNICRYLHETYPELIPIIIDKNNKTIFGSFPKYAYDYTYPSGYSLSVLNERIAQFCAHYGVGHISFDSSGLSGWALQSLLQSDNTHFTVDGYRILAEYLAGQVRKFIG